MVLDKKTIAMASGPNFAAFTTLFKDGSPQTHIMWVDTDGDNLLINTEIHRAKYINTNKFEQKNVVRTYSNAMDISRPSNLERLILIYDNNVKNFFPEEKVNSNNKIVIYDFETNQYSYYLDSSIKREDVRTREGGRSQILDNKDLIVEETDYGRTLYYNSDGFLRWQHVNRALDNSIYYISWSRVLYKPSDIKRVQYLLSLSACNNE